MTFEERERLRELSFHELWYSFWQGGSTGSGGGRNPTREFDAARRKFEALRAGSLNQLLDLTTCESETEWGFPKGRRNINETDVRCSLREFKEETGVQCKDIRVRYDLPRMQEVFTGCNRVRYKHVYLMACSRHSLTHSPPSPSSSSSSSSSAGEEHHHSAPANAVQANAVQDVVLQGDRGQLREVSRVCWMSAADVEARIRSYNPERKRMFQEAHAMVQRLRRDTTPSREISRET